MDGAKFERGLQGPEGALHLKDPAAAQDIAQETFLSAFAALKALRSEQVFPSWLRKIARNTALAWRRERDRSVPLEDADTLRSNAGGPEDEAEREAERIEGSFPVAPWQPSRSRKDLSRPRDPVPRKARPVP